MSSVSTISTDSSGESLTVEEMLFAQTYELLENFRENTFTLLDTRVVFSPSRRKQYYDRSRQLLEMIFDMRSSTEPVGPTKLEMVLENFLKIVNHGTKYDLSKILLLGLDDLFPELMSAILLDNLNLANITPRLRDFFMAVSEQIRKIHENLFLDLTRRQVVFRIERRNVVGAFTEYMKYAGCIVFVLDFLVGSTEPFTMKPKESRISCEVQDVSMPDTLATEPSKLVYIIYIIVLSALMIMMVAPNSLSRQ